GSRHSAMSLSAFDDTFAAGLLESSVQAVTEAIPVLLVCYDFPPLPPIARHRPMDGPFGLALLLQPERDNNTLAGLELRWPVADTSTALDDPDLEALRLGNPAGRGLPLLAAVARRERTPVVLEWNGCRGLRIDVAP
ncbi:MAG: beta-ketoacyl synthase chain length factor, partial [Methylococcaceae bacterium]|nr:beta-ketoacyl synthase chain length factor [Methylococcaceae bacterium]